MPAPACPRCDYDLSGLVATWTASCPMQAMCPECGAVSGSGLLFSGHPGPPWSVEHARRRILSHWLRTTAIALRPRLLWRGLRPNHPVRGRRLARMALGWLLCIHLLAAALVGGSWLWVAIQTPAILGSPPSWRGWGAWAPFLRGVSWPYGAQIAIPVSANQMFSNPALDFVILALAPYVAMAGLVYLGMRPLRRRELGAGQLARALVLSLPVAGAWTGVSVLVYIAAVVLDGRYGLGVAADVLALALFTGFATGLIWWWRCYVVEYLGRRTRWWVLVLMGLAALVVAWGIGVASEMILAGRG